MDWFSYFSSFILARSGKDLGDFYFTNCPQAHCCFLGRLTVGTNSCAQLALGCYFDGSDFVDDSVGRPGWNGGTKRANRGSTTRHHHSHLPGSGRRNIHLRKSFVICLVDISLQF